MIGGPPISTLFPYTPLFRSPRTYSSTARPYDAAGNVSASSNTAYVSTPAVADTSPPTTPTNLRVTAVSQTTITIAWSASTDNVGVTGYGVYRDGSLRGTVTTLAAKVLYLSCGRSYTLAVDAKDAAGNRS